MYRWSAHAFGVLALAGAVAACGTTTVDVGDGGTAASGSGGEPAVADPSPLESGVIVDPVTPTTVVPVEGSAAELLPEIGIEMSRLSGQISEGDEAATTAARIEALWASILPEVEATRPELVDGIQSTVDMASNAVDANRPADADKAFSVLTELIDEYTGDG